MNYRMFAKSLPGPKYTAKGWNCQDHSGMAQLACAQVIAVADGHGSSDCFRSEIGSEMAIDSVIDQTKVYCEDICGALGEQVRFGETGIRNFKYAVWRKWQETVRSDWYKRLDGQPVLGEDEVRFKSVSEKYKSCLLSENQEIVEKSLYRAYGTTLLFAVAIESQLLILQIGDGSCIVLQRNGEFRMPVPPDERNFMNMTVSLCEDEANQSIRHVVIDREPDSPISPVAVFLSSDGVDDCYPIFNNKQHLYKLYTIILENILKVGFEATEAEITENLLPGMTAKSSQDDISLAYFMIEDIEILKSTYEKIELNMR